MCLGRRADTDVDGEVRRDVRWRRWWRRCRRLDRRLRRLHCQTVATRCSDISRLETVARDGLLNTVLACNAVIQYRCAILPVIVLDIRQTVDVKTQPTKATGEPREGALLLGRRRRRRPRGRSSRAAAAGHASPVGDRRPEDGVRSREPFAFCRRSVVVHAVWAGDAVRRAGLVVVVVDVVGDDALLLLLLPCSARHAVVELLVLEARAAVVAMCRPAGLRRHVQIFVEPMMTAVSVAQGAVRSRRRRQYRTHYQNCSCWDSQ